MKAYAPKWPFFASQSYRFKDYSKVLLFDDDESFAGFPWYTVFCRMQRAGDPIITGFPRESIRSNLPVAGLTGGDHYILQNGDYWRSGNRNNTVFAEVDFLEQNTILADSLFLFWFFNQLRITRVNDDSGETSAMDLFWKYNTDWGPDIMWCAAAHDYIMSKRLSQHHRALHSMKLFNFSASASASASCVMIPTPVWHYDFGSVTQFYDRSSNAVRKFKKNGVHVVKILKTNDTFAKWMKSSEEDRHTFRGARKSGKWSGTKITLFVFILVVLIFYKVIRFFGQPFF